MNNRPFARARAILAATSLLLLLSSDVLAQEACTDGGTCTSGFCVDDVCCDSVCDGLCQGCSAAVKGGGDDGVCGLVPAGTVCTPSYCDGSSFHFHPADTCDASGVCVDGGASEDCLQSDGLCAFDLCHDTDGCEVVKAQDGTECGAGKACADGTCEDATSSSGGSSGDGGSDASGGGDGNSSAGGSTGTGFGGAGGVDLEGGSTDVNTSCACRSVGGNDRGSEVGWLGLLGAFIVFGRRRRLSRIL